VPISFSETTVLDGALGLRILTSREAVDYAALTQGAAVSLVVENEPPAKIRGSLVGVVAALADPSFEWGTTLAIAEDLGHRVVPPHLGEFSVLPSVRPEAARFAERILDEGLVTSEGAELVGLVSFGDVPMLVFLGGSIGLEVVRRAEPTGSLVDALRQRLG
jgi:hypothetical protein